jgi:hypothetical protein
MLTRGGLAGAAFTMEETGHMGMSNMWYFQQEDAAHAWPETPWALALEAGDFPNTPKSKSEINGKPFYKGEWFWESGFSKHPLNELELTRGGRTYTIRPVRGQLPTGGTRVIVGPLLEATKKLVTGEKVARYLSAELRDRIRKTGVKIEVVDNGPGFQRELMGQVFDPYVTSKPKGTGLGLAIVKKVVEEHGGRIEAHNAPEGGASVLVALPLNDQARAQLGTRETRKSEPRRERA